MKPISTNVPISKFLSRYLCLVFLILNYSSFAQIQDSTTTSNQSIIEADNLKREIGNSKIDLTKDLKNQLKPLDSLIEVAIANNPGLRAQQALVEAGKEQVKFGRREWQNGVFVSFNQNTGNQTLFYDSNNEPLGTQSQSVTTGYRLGLNVNLPLYLLFARTNRINIFKDELQVRKETKEKLKLDLARIVIGEYNMMISTHQILLIASNSRSTARVLMDMANQQFKQNDISIGDYTSIMGIATKSESDYEIAKRDFYTSYQMLEELLGVRLENLTR